VSGPVTHHGGRSHSQDAAGAALGDFTTDRRVLALSGMAILIGVLSAFVARALLWLIAVITNFAYHQRLSAGAASPADNQLGWWAVLVPVLGSLVIGLMARYGSEKIRGHGIPEAMEAILIGRSRMGAKVAVLKPLSSAISIGTGGPFGAEGPIIMTGGAFGSLFAQLVHLSPAERKTLLVAGAAGGMSAVFASPVAAVLLGVELLLFEWKPRSFIPVSLSAAAAMALRVPLLGTGPLFPMAVRIAPDGTTLLLALAAGIAAGLGSSLLTAMVYGAEDLFGRLPFHWMWWPALGGLVVGLGGLLSPRALGVGYDSIHDLLSGDLVGGALLGLLVVKMIIWSVALGSGTSGGVLAPLLIMGGCLGAAGSQALHLGDAGLWAAIGMGAMMGGTMRSPFTAIVFILELTHATALLPALLVACTASVLVTVLVMKRSILTEKVARRGHHVLREYAVNPLQRMFVGDVMLERVPTVSSTMTVADLAERLAQLDPVLTPVQAWPIVDPDGRLVGILTMGDLLESLETDPEGKAGVLEAGTSEPVVAYADELLTDALTRMAHSDVGRLPVVDHDDPRRLVGYLGRTGIVAAWTRGLEEETKRERGRIAVPLLRAIRRVRLLRRRSAGASID
jgi:H+/Cl- antiporter ClcA/CBS domain-containing protein